MAQTSILGRIGQLVRANVNSMLDEAEDPEKMLDQLIRDFTNNIAEAEEAVAQTVGNLRLLEDDAREAREASAEWLAKAKAASDRADALRAQGNTAEADRFDELAKLALRRQISLRGAGQDLRHPDRPADRAHRQAQGRANKLRVKREELVQKRDELVSRAKMAQAQMQVQQTLKERLGPRPDLRAQPLRGADPPPGGPGARAWRRSRRPRSRTSSPSSRAARRSSRSRRASPSSRASRSAREPRRWARARPAPEIPPSTSWKGPRARPLLHARPCGRLGAPAASGPVALGLA